MARKKATPRNIVEAPAQPLGDAAAVAEKPQGPPGAVLRPKRRPRRPFLPKNTEPAMRA